MVVKELIAKLGLEVEEGAFSKAEAVLGVLKKGAFGVVAAVGAVGMGLLEMGRETANAASDAYKLAQRMGVTTDAAQELAYAATATGSSAESLQTAMFRMRRTIDGAAHGSAEAQKALSGLGVPLKELYEMKPDEAFEKLAGGLSKVTDENSKATKAQGVFGRGVIDLLPLINKGAEGIAQFREEAHEMGLVLSEQTIKESREWKKEMRIAGEQVEALKFRVGALVVHGVVKLVKAWADFKRQHAEKIIGTLKSAVVLLTAATVAYGLANAGAIASAIAGWVTLGATATLTGLRMAAAWLASIGPIALAGVGIAMLYLGLDDLYHFFKGDKQTAIQKAIDGFRAQFVDWKTEIKDVYNWLNKLAGFGDEERDKKVKEAKDRQALPFGERVRLALGGAPRNPDGTLPNVGVASMFSPAPSLARPSVPGASGAPTVIAPNMPTTINVNAQPGMDGKEIAGHVRRELDDWHAGKVREAAAAVRR